ncbi:MAG: family 43 glycosylhydrolase [Proteobacteria bacterium]|nr:family 43 glycosylhydrolase [Pseudomonadota bacterium]
MCLAPCKTRIEYGSEWIHGENHPSNVDNTDGKVTWDGTCINDGSNSYAILSNGWKPYFEGNDRCIISLDYSGDCPDIDNICRTRVTYSNNWKPGPGHENKYYDEVEGVITWNGVCYSDHAVLSNGWAPYFNGQCGVSVRYTQCGPMFTNPVIGADAPDPGALLDNGTYYIVHTSGNTSGAYRVHASENLVNWKTLDYAFPNGSVPSWAISHFWAPEIHKVGSKYHIYFSAKHKDTGNFCVGVGIADNPQGPYKDIGRPLVSKANMGIIDASYFRDTDGKHYVLWKDDGNAVGQKTPVFIQQLNEAGTELIGPPTEILTNTLSWEGALVEGPWLIKKDKYYYLFYSGNGYASPAYALGVARATKVTGPYTKHGEPIIQTQGYFQGPGHGSVIQTRSGEWVHVYHSWISGKVNAYPPGRVMLVDRITWIDDWPMSYSAPLRRSQPYIQ